METRYWEILSHQLGIQKLCLYHQQHWKIDYIGVEVKRQGVSFLPSCLIPTGGFYFVLCLHADHFDLAIMKEVLHFWYQSHGRNAGRSRLFLKCLEYAILVRVVMTGCLYGEDMWQISRSSGNLANSSAQRMTNFIHTNVRGLFSVCEFNPVQGSGVDPLNTWEDPTGMPKNQLLLRVS